MIGSVDRSSDVNLTETGNQDGQSWSKMVTMGPSSGIFYTVEDGDNSGTFRDLQWNFHGIDRA